MKESPPEKNKYQMEQSYPIDQLSHEHNALSQKREVYEMKLHQLEMHIEKNLFEMHLIKKRDLKKANALQFLIDDLKKEWRDIKEELKAIDRKLEDLEDFKEKRNEMHRYLLKAILEKDSAKKEAYQTLEMDLLEKKEFFEELQGLSISLKEIYFKFKSASEALITKRKRSLLELFFGRNPKVIAATQLYQISQDSQSLEGILINFSIQKNHTEEFLDLYKNLRAFFLNLRKEVERPWKSSQFEKKFNEQEENYYLLLEKFNALENQLEQEISHFQLKKREFEIELIDPTKSQR